MNSVPKVKKEVLESRGILKSKGYRFFDNSSMGEMYAKLYSGMLKKAVIDTFGRISYYLTEKATKEERFLFSGNSKKGE